MKRLKKGRRFSNSAVRYTPDLHAIEMEPEELAMYVLCTEKEVRRPLERDGGTEYPL
jgi:hypothetical protein